MNKKMTADIVIIGHGIVGATLGLCLASTKLKIVIVDKAPLISGQILSSRVSSITLDNEILFQKKQVWQNIADNAKTPFTDIYVNDKTGSGKIHFASKLLGVSHLASIVHNDSLLYCLQQKLLENDNIQFIQAGIRDSFLQSDYIEIKLDNEQSIQAKLLVGADGARSKVRELAQIGLEREPYQQQAIVATLQTEHVHQHAAYQIFSSTGPLAYLPLADSNTVSIVWSQADEQAKRLIDLSVSEFEIAVANALNNQLGVVKLTSQCQSFPLVKQHATSYIANRIVLLGDACHTIHPLAGLGLNLGIKDAKFLAELIIQGLNNKRDIGNPYLLTSYQRKRRADNQKTIHAMDAFHYLFTSQLPVARLSRNMGLNLTNKLSVIKSEIMRFALGNNR